MRSIFSVLTIVGLLIAKDVNYKIQNLTADSPNLVSVYGITQDQQDPQNSKTANLKSGRH